ncbi:MAG TPA: MBL fold metallo-hydrolase, partial [Candidatus Kryptonia bacterium]|nr:MBL fold metallo-hydrolase [Candidatus Kryptonia bacterium]
MEIRVGEDLIILDAGTGVFQLGLTLPQPVHATFLMTHFHWDHIQGFPLFRPAYQAGNCFTFFAPGSSDDEVAAVFAKQMEPPNFPVPLDALSARLEFRALHGGEEFAVGSARIRTAILNHPQGCLGYRITVGDASVAFATDTEPIAPGEVDPALLDLARGVDLLIHDSQYTDDEYDGHCGPARKGWGHSTFTDACAVARRAGVGQLVLFHHDPSHDDEFI